MSRRPRSPLVGEGALPASGAHVPVVGAQHLGAVDQPPRCAAGRTRPSRCRRRTAAATPPRSRPALARVQPRSRWLGDLRETGQAALGPADRAAAERWSSRVCSRRATPARATAQPIVACQLEERLIRHQRRSVGRPPELRSSRSGPRVVLVPAPTGTGCAATAAIRPTASTSRAAVGCRPAYRDRRGAAPTAGARAPTDHRAAVQAARCVAPSPSTHRPRCACPR